MTIAEIRGIFVNILFPPWERGDYAVGRFVTFNRLERFMEKVKNPGEIQNLPSVKNVKLVVRFYETRTAFSDLTNRII
jgi:hypothetical protein